MASYEDYVKRLTKAYDPKLKVAQSESNRIYNEKISDVEEEYHNKIKAKKKEHSEGYDLKEIEKMLNKRALNERMGNLGLTDSGVNRAGIDATEEYYQKGIKEKLKKEKEAVSYIENNLAAEISDLNMKKDNAALDISNQYTKMIAADAESMYKAWLKAEADKEKARVQLQKLQNKATNKK